MEMLKAAQDAAVAGHSAASAAWWGLGLNALTALGAVGALWYAIVQGNRTARFERLRAAMELTKILEAVGPVADFLTLNEDGRIDPSDALYLMEGRVLTDSIEAIQSASLEHVPSTQAVSYLQVLRTTLPSLKTTLELPFFPTELYRRDLDAIAEAVDYMTLFRDVLLRNSWKARRELKARF